MKRLTKKRMRQNEERNALRVYGVDMQMSANIKIPREEKRTANRLKKM